MDDANCALRVEDLLVDRVRRQVSRGGKVLPLSALSFDTLLALLEAAPAPLTPAELIARAWQGQLVSDEAVTQRIRLLRRALGDDSKKPRYIATLRSAGYRLVPPVVPISEVGRLSRFRTWALIGVLAVLLIAFSYRSYSPDQEPGLAAKTSIPTAPVSAAELASKANRLFSERNPTSLAHAIGLYERALALEPENQEIRARLALTLAISVAWYSDRPEVARRAEALARESLANSQSFDAEFALAVSLDARGRVEEAMAAYERSLALRPGHAGARASLAYVLQVKGRLVEALSHNVAVMNQMPSGNLDVQVASCLRLLGFHSIATRWLQRADQLTPGSAHAAPVRALDLISRGEYKKAREVIDQAIGRGVEQVELYEYLAVLALMNTNWAAARTALASAPQSINHRWPFEIWRLIIDAMEARSAGEEIDPRVTQKSLQLQSNVDAGDSWPDNHLYIALLEASAGRDQAAMEALQRLQQAGFRDYLWLDQLPPFRALRAANEFPELIQDMREDVDRQRRQVMTAEWLPAELRQADPDLAITSLLPAE